MSFPPTCPCYLIVSVLAPSWPESCCPDFGETQAVSGSAWASWGSPGSPSATASVHQGHVRFLAYSYLSPACTDTISPGLWDPLCFTKELTGKLIYDDEHGVQGMPIRSPTPLQAWGISTHIFLSLLPAYPSRDNHVYHSFIKPSCSKADQPVGHGGQSLG